MTDVGLERLAAGCPNLNHLDLCECNRMTDVGLERLAVGCPNLNDLNLCGCQVTGVGLERMAAVTGVGLERIAAGFPNLHAEHY